MPKFVIRDEKQPTETPTEWWLERGADDVLNVMCRNQAAPGHGSPEGYAYHVASITPEGLKLYGGCGNPKLGFRFDDDYGRIKLLP